MVYPIMKGVKPNNIILYMNRLRSYVIILIKAGNYITKVNSYAWFKKKKITELWIKETSKQLKDLIGKKKIHHYSSQDGKKKL